MAGTRREAKSSPEKRKAPGGQEPHDQALGRLASLLCPKRLLSQTGMHLNNLIRAQTGHFQPRMDGTVAIVTSDCDCGTEDQQGSMSAMVKGI